MTGLPPIPGWTEYFMRQAYLVSTKSKDTRTKIGAVLVRDKRAIAGGYNGLCCRMNDNIPERYERPVKYFYFEHGERNAIYQCANLGVSCNGAEMYTMGTPCADCARAVIQSGVRKVITHKQWVEYEKVFYRAKWEESCAISKAMLSEAGVESIEFDLVLGLSTLMDGTKIDV